MAQNDTPKKNYAVKLLKNHIYPTYQLHAFMRSGRTDPADGLKIGVITVLRWLARRLGDNAPEAWNHLPEPQDYHRAGSDLLTSVHISEGYVIDIVALPDEGVWTLQITEPHLGSNPGAPDQKIAPVAGRMIESNIGFHIVGQRLECGFQTVISDPEGTSPMAEVFRFAIIRDLIENPDFGLMQITPLTMELTVLDSAEKVRAMLRVQKDPENHLPAVIFTQTVSAAVPAVPVMPDPSAFLKLTARASAPLPGKPLSIPGTGAEKKIAADPPYDCVHFAKRAFTFCRVYLLKQSQEERFRQNSGVRIRPGDVIFLEPSVYGGAHQSFRLAQSKSAQAETLSTVYELAKQYLRQKPVDFGTISYLSAARDRLVQATNSLARQAQDQDVVWKTKIDQLSSQWRAYQFAKEREIAAQLEQISRLKATLNELYQAQDDIRASCEAEVEKKKRQLEEKDSEIEFLKSKLDRPTTYPELIRWIHTSFAGRLLLHPAAENKLSDRSLRTEQIPLLCDMLCYLASEYWEYRYLRLPEDQMNHRCAKKYGRPFEVRPSGSAAIQMFPTQYRIPYGRSPQGKTLNAPLDYHLRVGNQTELLIRIYFLFDDERKLIVIGSLPKHLDTTFTS